MPLYNKGAYIGKTLGSLLQQEHPSWELLVVNNRSTDGGAEIIQKCNDSKVCLLNCNRQTGGPGAPRNFGISRATGKWILFLDADDLLLPSHLSCLLKTAKSHPKADIIAGWWQEFPGQEPEQRVLKQPAGYPQATAASLESTIAGAPWACHAALVKREILKPPYLWVEELDPYLSEDTAFWFRLLTRYKVAYSDNQGALYRRVDNARDRYQDVERWFTGIHAVLQNNIAFLETQNLPLTANHCEALMRRYSDIYLLALRQNRTDIASESLHLAQYWLNQCANLSGLTTLPLKLRHWLSLRPFLQIQHWRKQCL
jgi:glycosyltransferase involved in cell wall biosynthesis